MIIFELAILILFLAGRIIVLQIIVLIIVMAYTIRYRKTCKNSIFTIFIFIFIISCLISYNWSYSNRISKEQISNIQDIIKDAWKQSTEILSHNMQQTNDNYKKRNKDENSQILKFILVWTSQRWEPMNYLLKGRKKLIENNCTYTNCYVTTNRSYFGDNISRFDALAFNGRNLLSIKDTDLPRVRSSHQKYIFFNMESAENYPICNKILDGFFNWTSTYKLNSDIPCPYILIKDKNGTVVGPGENVKWLEKMDDVDDELLTRRIENKTKAAAWFVSNCHDRSGRKYYVTRLRNELKHYGLKIDEYGKCSSSKCKRGKKKCWDMIEKDYFFYLSLENSMMEDYVTEKLLNALHHYAIPIVLGGADYKRFLPPGSYLNIHKYQSPEELAAEMHRLITTPKEYRQYFRWRHHYTYSDPKRIENVCAVCAALNNKTMMETRTTYDNFRKWWHSGYEERCNRQY